jgi:hypothetical protein
MLNRLRRAHGRAGGGAVGFDVKVMRWLLAYWRGASALQQRVGRDRASAAVVGEEAKEDAEAQTNDDDDDDEEHMKDSDDGRDEDEDENYTRPALTVADATSPDLHLLVWPHTSEAKKPQVLEPWDVVPVTRAQLHRLRHMPRGFWREVLSASVLADVDARLVSVRRQLTERRA